MKKSIPSPFNIAGYTNDDELKSALRYYVAQGILQKMMIDGKEHWKESEKFGKLSKEEQAEWLDRVSKNKNLPF